MWKDVLSVVLRMALGGGPGASGGTALALLLLSAYTYGELAGARNERARAERAGRRKEAWRKGTPALWLAAGALFLILLSRG